MSANVETGRVDLVLTLEFHATSRAACTVVFFAGGAGIVPTSATVRSTRPTPPPPSGHSPSPSPGPSRSPRRSPPQPSSGRALGSRPGCAWGCPASMPTVLKRSLQRCCMGATFGSVTERLTKTVRDAGVTLEDFGHLANEEVIRLSRKMRKIGDWRESRTSNANGSTTPTPPRRTPCGASCAA